MELKIATKDDAPAIMRMALAFFQASPYKKYGVDEARVKELVNQFVRKCSTRLCLCLWDGDKCVGVLGAVAVQNIYNTRYTCIELMWWIDPEHRGLGQAKSMVDAYEYWARHKIKAQSINLVTLDPALGKLYNRLGFEKKEESYSKEL
jgi:RimJ/RimL family protein N-acetyltransferase